MKKILGWMAGLCVMACAPFQDSPFSDQVLNSETSLNNIAASRLVNIEADGVIRIAIFADPHQNYKELDKVILSINRTADVDFVVGLGDFTNSSYNLEYDQFLVSYLRFTAPALTTIGNHDSIGAGPNLFRKIFGELNFSFESTSSKFIFFNSANLENPDGFNPNWLLDQVTSSTKPVFIFTHVPLQDPERFLGSNQVIMTNVVQHANTKAVFNGHRHVYQFAKESGTMLVQGPRAAEQRWLLVEITGTQFEVREVNGGGSVSDTLKP